MSISTLSRKLLWGNAASHCSMSNCRRPLAHHSDESGKAVVIGEEAHIVAKSPDGPRGDSPLSSEQRDEYSNLILLCPTHHALVDKAPQDYSVDVLLDVKLNHEAWVREALGGVVNSADVKWAGLVDQLDTRLSLDTWADDISPLFSGGTASISVPTDRRLRACIVWIATRPWPSGQERLKTVIINIGQFLNEALHVFSEHAEPNRREERLVFQAFYKIPTWNENLYNSLLADYKSQREYLSDLALELTRYVNLFGDVVRSDIDPSFRQEEGYAALRIEGGFLQFDLYVPKFTAGEISQAEREDATVVSFQTGRLSRSPRFHW